MSNLNHAALARRAGAGAAGGGRLMGEQPNPSGFTDELRALCRERCAFYGDPPCCRLPDLVQPCEQITPCDECLAGVPPEGVTP